MRVSRIIDLTLLNPLRNVAQYVEAEQILGSEALGEDPGLDVGVVRFPALQRGVFLPGAENGWNRLPAFDAAVLLSAVGGIV